VIDDLESFIWVLLWSVLSILESRDVLQQLYERGYLASMRLDGFLGLRSRRGMRDLLDLQQTAGTFSKGLVPFAPIFTQWLRIARYAELKTLTLPSDTSALEMYAKGVYEEYIEAGLELMSSLPESWDYVEAQ
jgi:hypothetical protein